MVVVVLSSQTPKLRLASSLAVASTTSSAVDLSTSCLSCACGRPHLRTQSYTGLGLRQHCPNSHNLFPGTESLLGTSVNNIRKIVHKTRSHAGSLWKRDSRYRSSIFDARSTSTRAKPASSSTSREIRGNEQSTNHFKMYVAKPTVSPVASNHVERQDNRNPVIKKPTDCCLKVTSARCVVAAGVLEENVQDLGQAHMDPSKSSVNPDEIIEELPCFESPTGESSYTWDPSVFFYSSDSGNSEQLLSKVSCCSDSGFSTVCSPKKKDHHRAISYPVEDKTVATLIESRSTPAPVSKVEYAESLSQILESGDEEFRKKYSAWVSELFHLQLTKMHRRISYYYKKKIESVNCINVEKMSEIHFLDQKKMSEAERALEKYRKWVEVLTKENNKLKAAKNAVIEDITETLQQIKQNFQIDMDSRLNDVRADCEQEKLNLQQKHAEQLKIFLEKSCGQIEKIENEYRVQVGALNQLINNLKTKNDVLEKEVKAFRRVEVGSPHTHRTNYVGGSYAFQREKDHLLALIQDLRNQLYESEKDRLAAEAIHEEKVSTLKAEVYSTERDLLQKLEMSHNNFEQLRQTKDNEIQGLKDLLAIQETETKKILNDLKGNYGSKIESLAEKVEQLQVEIGVQHER